MSALEYSANVKAEVVGKPSGKFFLSSIADLDVKPDECVMIGDVVFNFLFLMKIFMSTN